MINLTNVKRIGKRKKHRNLFVSHETSPDICIRFIKLPETKKVSWGTIIFADCET